MRKDSQETGSDARSVPVLDLRRQYETIQEELDAAVLEVLGSAKYILGPYVQSFEEKAAAYCGARHAVGVASGTDALLLSLRALGVGAGDAVILPSFTFFATAGVVHNVGATPVFCDIQPDSFNLDPADAAQRLEEAAKTMRVKAIIPVHLYGQIADMDEISAIAHHHDAAVIEDAAQAIGATIERQPVARGTLHAEEACSKDIVDGSQTSRGSIARRIPAAPQATSHKLHATRAGSIGALGCFSFYPTKNLGAYGDGGMVTTDDDGLAEQLRLLRVHGAKPKYFHKAVGFNSRLDALQAAILSVKLDHLDAWSAARAEKADRYDKGLAGIEGIVPPRRMLGRSHIFHQYTIRVLGGRRDALRAHLKDHGIGTMIYYPRPLHLQECFAHLGYREGDLPESERASAEALSLPIFPEITDQEQDYVIEAITRFAGR